MIQLNNIRNKMESEEAVSIQEQADFQNDQYKDRLAEEQMEFAQVEEMHRQFIAEKRVNNGRVFDIKTQRYEDENNN